MTTTDSAGREFSERPWGNYTVLDDTADSYKVKQIVVTPGKRLSYQTHKFRSEHWFIISGNATVVLDGATIPLAPGGSVDIHVGQAHRCENQGSEPVVFIEIQTGTYFGEDDIVRLEDDFGRAS
jgi:mannose-6-phosphate isomerase-like protein (cupin superfamily)